MNCVFSHNTRLAISHCCRKKVPQLALLKAIAGNLQQSPPACRHVLWLPPQNHHVIGVLPSAVFPGALKASSVQSQSRRHVDPVDDARGSSETCVAFRLQHDLAPHICRLRVEQSGQSLRIDLALPEPARARASLGGVKAVVENIRLFERSSERGRRGGSDGIPWRISLGTLWSRLEAACFRGWGRGGAGEWSECSASRAVAITEEHPDDTAKP